MRKLVIRNEPRSASRSALGAETPDANEKLACSTHVSSASPHSIATPSSRTHGGMSARARARAARVRAAAAAAARRRAAPRPQALLGLGRAPRSSSPDELLALLSPPAELGVGGRGPRARRATSAACATTRTRRRRRARARAAPGRRPPARRRSVVFRVEPGHGRGRAARAGRRPPAAGAPPAALRERIARVEGREPVVEDVLPVDLAPGRRRPPASGPPVARIGFSPAVTTFPRRRRRSPTHGRAPAPLPRGRRAGGCGRRPRCGRCCCIGLAAPAARRVVGGRAATARASASASSRPTRSAA